MTDQIKHNMTKDPNWREANQLAIYMRGWDLNSGPPGCESNALTTRPRCLLYVIVLFPKRKKLFAFKIIRS